MFKVSHGWGFPKTHSTDLPKQVYNPKFDDNLDPEIRCEEDAHIRSHPFIILPSCHRRFLHTLCMLRCVLMQTCINDGGKEQDLPLLYQRQRQILQIHPLYSCYVNVASYKVHLYSPSHFVQSFSESIHHISMSMKTPSSSSTKGNIWCHVIPMEVGHIIPMGWPSLYDFGYPSIWSLERLIFRVKRYPNSKPSKKHNYLDYKKLESALRKKVHMLFQIIRLFPLGKEECFLVHCS